MRVILVFMLMGASLFGQGDFDKAGVNTLLDQLADEAFLPSFQRFHMIYFPLPAKALRLVESPDKAAIIDILTARKATRQQMPKEPDVSTVDPREIFDENLTVILKNNSRIVAKDKDWIVVKVELPRE